MRDRIEALRHIQKLNRELIQAYDGLMGECALTGDAKGFDKWLNKALECERHNFWIDKEIDRIDMERR